MVTVHVNRELSRTRCVFNEHWGTYRVFGARAGSHHARPPTPVFPEAWDPRNIAIVRDVALLLNVMRDAGVVSDYALFGAAAQMRYTEAVATVDADVLVAGPAPDCLDVPEPTETERLLRRQADWQATASSPPSQ